MRRALPLLLTALGLLFATVAPAQERVELSDAGFAITIASADWQHQAAQSDGRTAVVGIGPPSLGGFAQITVQIELTTEDGPEASQAVLDALRAQVQLAPGIDLGENATLTLAGQSAPGFELLQEAQGQTFKVHLYYLTTNGFQYRIQFHAPKDQFEELWPIAQETLASFELLQADDSVLEVQQLQALAARCGSEIDWAADWETAASRAKSERKLIVVAVASNQGFSLGSPLMEGPFSHPEVVALMNNRFVGYEWKPGRDEPFTRQDVWGMSSTALGTGLLLCLPSGEVVNEIFLPEAELTAFALRKALHGHPGLTKPIAPLSLQGADKVEWAIDNGLLDDARSWLGKAPKDGDREAAGMALQRARLLRIEQDFEGARRALASVSKDATLREQQEADLMGAALATDLGENELAMQLVQGVLEAESLDSDLGANAKMQYATSLWITDQREQLEAELRDLCVQYPDEPAAWVAAAALTGYALKIDVAPSLEAFKPGDFDMALIPAPAASRTSLNQEQALPDAVRWLLDQQREDGSWANPIGIRDSQKAPDPISMATQALAVQSLFEFGSAAPEEDLCMEALIAAARGLENYLDRRPLVREHPRVVAFMDYTCWGSSYGAAMLAQVLRLDGGDLMKLSPETRDRCQAELQHCVNDLQRIVQANGGWSYYLSGEFDGEALIAAMSFTTATVLNALQDARAQGAEVDAEVLENGYACLLSMRGTNEAFDYLTAGAELPTLGEVEVIGGSARGPLCAFALVREEILQPADLQLPFERYAEHLASFGKQSRRALMHCGPQAQGSHYLMYDYMTAAEVLSLTPEDAIPSELAGEVREAILTQMALCHSADGSFIDNPLIGAVASTSLAVQALLRL